jgi:hypothetical protein
VEPRSTELYQLGFNPLIAAHDMQLKHVLWNWVAMVEEGKWEVDADGVVGGIEKWREADTEEHWSDYQLPMTWWSGFTEQATVHFNILLRYVLLAQQPTDEEHCMDGKRAHLVDISFEDIVASSTEK